MSPLPLPPPRFAEGGNRGRNEHRAEMGTHPTHMILPCTNTHTHTHIYSLNVFFPFLAFTEKKKHTHTHKLEAQAIARPHSQTHTLHPPIDYVLVILTHTHNIPWQIKTVSLRNCLSSDSRHTRSHTGAVVLTHTQHLQLVPQIAFH